MKEKIESALRDLGVPNNTFLLLGGLTGFMGISASATNCPVLHFSAHHLKMLDCDQDDIRAMLSHELGHWELGHCRQRSSLLFLLPILSLVSLFFASWFGSTVLFFCMIFGVFGLWIHCQRQKEHDADAFAVDMLKSLDLYLNMLDKIRKYEEREKIHPVLHPSANSRKNFLKRMAFSNIVDDSRKMFRFYE